MIGIIDIAVACGSCEIVNLQICCVKIKIKKIDTSFSEFANWDRHLELQLSCETWEINIINGNYAPSQEFAGFR